MPSPNKVSYGKTRIDTFMEHKHAFNEIAELNVVIHFSWTMLLCNDLQELSKVLLVTVMEQRFVDSLYYSVKECKQTIATCFIHSLNI